jgi:hypothetical protein
MSLKLKGDRVITYEALRKKTYPEKFHDKFLLLLELKPLTFEIVNPIYVKSNVRAKDDTFRLPYVCVIVNSADSIKELEKSFKKKYSKYSKVVWRDGKKSKR